MRVLMIAPEPVLSPRGTPISVANRCRALSALGHEVDLVTYPIGEDFEAPGLRILRAPGIPGLGRVRIGPSVAKLPLDTLVFLRAAVQLMRRRYDVIHTHEEAGAFGWWAHRLTRIPHLHDMHNDLAMVLTNYGISERHPLTRFASWLERRIVRSAAVVIVVFPELANLVEKYAPGRPVHLIHNVPSTSPRIRSSRLSCVGRGRSMVSRWSSIQAPSSHTRGSRCSSRRSPGCPRRLTGSGRAL
jgi:hypothetical protein